MSRGVVLGLDANARRDRMLYLAGELTYDKLTHMSTRATDLHRISGYADAMGALITPVKCPTFFYLLKDYNGGTDPTAPDPCTRWRKPKTKESPNPIENRTADCIGGQAWCGGFDRLQKVRFPFYGGYINTDSMRMDAGAKKPACFRRLDRPEPGCFVVYASDPDGKVHGHKVGHIGGVVSVPAEYAPDTREWWDALGVVDVAARVGRANKRTTGRGWYKTDAWFVIPTMVP